MGKEKKKFDTKLFMSFILVLIIGIAFGFFTYHYIQRKNGNPTIKDVIKKNSDKKNNNTKSE